jgi:hypothetical protein
MNVQQYKERVIALFKSGSATDEQWNEMASAVLHASIYRDSVPMIDFGVGFGDEEAA